jgi:hypothetical protein
MKKSRDLNHFYFVLITFLALLALCATPACVSVNIGAKAGSKSKGVTYNPPAAPFENLNDTPADSAWQNKKNGNSISFYSTCNDPSDPPLESVSKDLFVDMSDMKVIRQDLSQYNGREALNMEVEGKIDGVDTRVRSVVFKKNDCIYTLSFIGLPKSFEQDRVRFENFIGSFQAP